MNKKLYIINGPNLTFCTREPEKTGNISLDEIKKYCDEKCNNYNLDLSFFNQILRRLIGEIHNAINDGQGIIISRALTHTSIGLLDALNMFKGPKIELHITNIYARESFRHKSYISPVVNGMIAGFGFNSTRLP